MPSRLAEADAIKALSTQLVEAIRQKVLFPLSKKNLILRTSNWYVEEQPNLGEVTYSGKIGYIDISTLDEGFKEIEKELVRPEGEISSLFKVASKLLADWKILIEKEVLENETPPNILKAIKSRDSRKALVTDLNLDELDNRMISKIVAFNFLPNAKNFRNARMCSLLLSSYVVSNAPTYSQKWVIWASGHSEFYDKITGEFSIPYKEIKDSQLMTLSEGIVTAQGIAATIEDYVSAVEKGKSLEERIRAYDGIACLRYFINEEKKGNIIWQ